MALEIERGIAAGEVEEVYGRLVGFWAAGLLPHFRAENECLLARLIRHVPVGNEAVRRTQQDHLQMEGLVATMRDTQSAEDRERALAEFGRALKEHIRWEESVLFEVTQTKLTDAELDVLAAEIEERLPGMVTP